MYIFSFVYFCKRFSYIFCTTRLVGKTDIGPKPSLAACHCTLYLANKFCHLSQLRSLIWVTRNYASDYDSASVPSLQPYHCSVRASWPVVARIHSIVICSSCVCRQRVGDGLSLPGVGFRTQSGRPDRVFRPRQRQQQWRANVNWKLPTNSLIVLVRPQIS